MTATSAAASRRRRRLIGSPRSALRPCRSRTTPEPARARPATRARWRPVLGSPLPASNPAMAPRPTEVSRGPSTPVQPVAGSAAVAPTRIEVAPRTAARVGASRGASRAARTAAPWTAAEVAATAPGGQPVATARRPAGAVTVPVRTRAGSSHHHGQAGGPVSSRGSSSRSRVGPTRATSATSSAKLVRVAPTLVDQTSPPPRDAARTTASAPIPIRMPTRTARPDGLPAARATSAVSPPATPRAARVARVASAGSASSPARASTRTTAPQTQTGRTQRPARAAAAIGVPTSTSRVSAPAAIRSSSPPSGATTRRLGSSTRVSSISTKDTAKAPAVGVRCVGSATGGLQRGRGEPRWRRYGGLIPVREREEQPVRTSVSIPGAEPWSAIGQGPLGRTGVVVVHGFTANPVGTRPLGQRLAAEGYSVEVPLLPGHGTSHRDLARTGYADWVGAVEDIVNRLATRTDRLALIGHSMGGTISLDLAARRAEVVD